MQSIDWGSVPDWLAGVGAVVALIFAGIAARAALRANSQQNIQILAIEAQERERAAEKRRWQASKVGIWLYPHTSSFPTIHFFNGSGFQIYDATAVATCHDSSTTRRYGVSKVRGFESPNEQPVQLARLTESFHALLESHEVAAVSLRSPPWQAHGRVRHPRPSSQQQRRETTSSVQLMGRREKGYHELPN
jgi:hypothetical protein